MQKRVALLQKTPYSLALNHGTPKRESKVYFQNDLMFATWGQSQGHEASIRKSRKQMNKKLVLNRRELELSRAIHPGQNALLYSADGLQIKNTDRPFCQEALPFAKKADYEASPI